MAKRRFKKLQAEIQQYADNEVFGDHTPDYVTDYATAVDVTDLQTDVTDLQSNVSDLLTDVAALETDVAALNAAVVLKGTWDASAGTFPGGGSAQAGWSYIVSVGGTVDGTIFSATDRIVALVDNASTSVYASNWHKLDYTDVISSVDGMTGAVVLSSIYHAKMTQQSAISDPSGGATVDSEARTAITSILTALRTLGLIAS